MGRGFLKIASKVVNFNPIKPDAMQEGKRQKQVAAVIMEELNDIFQRLGLNVVDGGMVSISTVKVTPDLLEARVYLSLFKVPDSEAAFNRIESRTHEIKRELATRVKHQLRRIPEMKYFLDDTLEQVFRMEEVFKNIRDDKKT
jgi:ribosome-binding factor A